MQENQVSVTALVTAYARAYHATHDDPKIFNDFLAHHMFTEQERSYLGHNLAESLKFFDLERAALCPDQATALAWVIQTYNGSTTLSRSRYTEDSLEVVAKQGVQQYIILGAGMDTFAFRRPDMVGQLQVFEVDHPGTQAFKLSRLAELGWEHPAELHFIPVDFTEESLEEALKHSSYDPQKLSFFSWLGVTMYLTRDEVFDTLRSIASIAPAGSAVIFDYYDTDAFDPEKASKRAQLTQEIVRRTGEPMKTGFKPSTLATDIAALGLRLHENLSPADIEARYFQGRTDNYHAFEHVHFAWTVVA
ncbi:MAG TPA: class I SAM-dependent methyltransferase [Anaerolineae bacterium]|jgi:methyltransferase (TIGR00027 family)|nr:class I SAM-dependent methyltransferase [Anaerolineae bacterium]